VIHGNFRPPTRKPHGYMSFKVASYHLVKQVDAKFQHLPEKRLNQSTPSSSFEITVQLVLYTTSNLQQQTCISISYALCWRSSFNSGDSTRAFVNIKTKKVSLSLGTTLTWSKWHPNKSPMRSMNHNECLFSKQDTVRFYQTSYRLTSFL
jgi:hypothetical protein